MSITLKIKCKCHSQTADLLKKILKINDEEPFIIFTDETTVTAYIGVEKENDAKKRDKIRQTHRRLMKGAPEEIQNLFVNRDWLDASKDPIDQMIRGVCSRDEGDEPSTKKTKQVTVLQVRHPNGTTTVSRPPTPPLVVVETDIKKMTYPQLIKHYQTTFTGKTRTKKLERLGLIREYNVDNFKFERVAGPKQIEQDIRPCQLLETVTAIQVDLRERARPLTELKRQRGFDMEAYKRKVGPPTNGEHKVTYEKMRDEMDEAAHKAGWLLDQEYTCIRMIHSLNAQQKRTSFKTKVEFVDEYENTHLDEVTFEDFIQLKKATVNVSSVTSEMLTVGKVAYKSLLDERELIHEVVKRERQQQLDSDAVVMPTKTLTFSHRGYSFEAVITNTSIELRFCEADREAADAFHHKCLEDLTQNIGIAAREVPIEEITVDWLKAAMNISSISFVKLLNSFKPHVDSVQPVLFWKPAPVVVCSEFLNECTK